MKKINNFENFDKVNESGYSDNEYKLWMIQESPDGNPPYILVGIVKAKTKSDAYKLMGIEDRHIGFYPIREINERQYNEMYNKIKKEFDIISNIIE